MQSSQREFRIPKQALSAGLCAAVLASGCLDWSSLSKPAAESPEAGEAAEPVDVFAAAAQEAEAGEGPYLIAARPFIEAIARRDAAAAFAQLSSHARSRMTLNQFVAPDDEAELAAGEQQAVENVTIEQFADYLKKAEEAYCVPAIVSHVYVETMDSAVLSGRGDASEVAWAIGRMPESIPVQIRKASVQAQFLCPLSEEDIKALAESAEVTPDEVRQNPQRYAEGPYFKLRAVLVEDAGTLKVGYFELIPPSIWD